MLERLKSLPSEGLLDWTAALQLWQFHREHLGNPQPKPDSRRDNSSTELSRDTTGSTGNGGETEKRDLAPSNSPGVEEERQVEVTGEKSSCSGEGERLYGSLLKKERLTFRVTCTRTGQKRGFSSPDAAGFFGAGLAEYFNWKVQLKNPDIEVLLALSENEVRVGVALNREAKFKRNIAHFGPTTLRATIGYGMLR